MSRMPCRITDEMISYDPADAVEATPEQFWDAYEELYAAMSDEEKFEAISEMPKKDLAMLFSLIDKQHDCDIGYLIRQQVKHYWLNNQWLIDKAQAKANEWAWDARYSSDE